MKSSLVAIALAIATSMPAFARDLRDGYVVSNRIEGRVTVEEVVGFKTIEKQDAMDPTQAGIYKLRGELLMKVEGNICMSDHVISQLKGLKLERDRKDRTEVSTQALTLHGVGKTYQQADGCTQHSSRATIRVPMQVSAMVGPPTHSMYQTSVHHYVIPLGYSLEDKKTEYARFTVKLEHGKGWSVSPVSVSTRE